MSDEEKGAARRPHAKALAASFLEFDLDREIDLLRRENGGANGQNARTLVKHDDIRVVLIALQKGSGIPEHQAPGRISVQTLRGEIRMRALGKTFALPVGGLLSLDRDVPHSVEAREDSAFLLTLVHPSPERQEG